MLKNNNIKFYVWVLLIISFVLWIIIASIKEIEWSNILEHIKIIPWIVTLDTILIVLFIKWIWRLKYLQGRLVLIPDLNGAWEGTIQSNWINPETHEAPKPIPVILNVKQTLTHISCVMRTAEMTSYSIAQAFNIDKDNQIRQLAYVYTSKPSLSVANRSNQHDGAIIFDIIGNPARKLKGQYWTARKSTGDIILTFREKKLLDEMPDDLT
jgi:hypothetical protein